ncbi:thiamine pyrophosphate-dependent dehydrogenase E1 component subunit alpha [Pseudogracilibacillus sp. ICA-222130]|uniref:thiamine pyrophosphate-dependent dehydrogenase E1 component subunit alpha n=1 Tax=Pseudogracilibacillus sp. ICA-222130 TaxID=3134655 RepID=UPI0030C0F85A
MNSVPYERKNIEEWFTLYEKMVRIRQFENEVEKNVQRGHLHGTTHLYNGQEAVAVGVCSALQNGDYISSTHRGHGHAIAMGADIHKMMAEMFGKITGYSKGKGGSMHIADIEEGNLGSNGVVGGGIPIAVGAGLSMQMQQKNNVVACFFGDGAINEGSFHEALNMASIWQVPVIFICENNMYGMSSAIGDMTNIDQLSERAVAYGIPGVTIDGNDVLVVKETMERAVERARNGAGPTFIEAKTYRFKGHSKSDKQLYRMEEEVEAYKKRDPLIQLEQKLLHVAIEAAGRIKAIHHTVQKEVDAATEFATASDEPGIDELYKDVYAIREVEL